MLGDVDITRPGWVADFVDIDITHTFGSAMGGTPQICKPVSAK